MERRHGAEAWRANWAIAGQPIHGCSSLSVTHWMKVFLYSCWSKLLIIFAFILKITYLVFASEVVRKSNLCFYLYSLYGYSQCHIRFWAISCWSKRWISIRWIKALVGRRIMCAVLCYVLLQGNNGVDVVAHRRRVFSMWRNWNRNW